MPRINKTKYAVLGVLSITPGSGYDIKKFCDRGISQFWSENFGQIYPVLKHLEEEELVTRKVEQTEGKPSRNVYFITPKGLDELKEWLVTPIEPTPARLELLLRMTFAKIIPREKMIETIQQVREKHIQRLDGLMAAEQGLINDEPVRNSEGYPYWLATVRYGIYDAQFRIKWCEETIEHIQTHQTKQ